MNEFEKQVNEAIDRALEEDLGKGDITTDALIDKELTGNAGFLIKADGILAGIEIARQVFLKIEPAIKMEIRVTDGSPVKTGDIVAVVSSGLGAILKGERIALNFLQRLSGIATETSRFVNAVRDLPVKILDTRKTTPGLRFLEKYAVSMGGGQNHRMNLADGILIKDNHLAALYGRGLNLIQIVAKARKSAPANLPVEVETQTLDEVKMAVASGADIIMLDNMSLDMMRQAVRIINGRARVEASGGVNINTVREIAGTGVDYISIGSLTHSIKSLDISLEFDSKK
jgi:nicotinate-nucleotide pyrophosphorylase (carboxylating)